MAKKNRAVARDAALVVLRDEGAPLAIGPRLRALREAAELTLSELADLIGASGPGLFGWEIGRNPPSGAYPAKLEAWSTQVVGALELPPQRVLRAAEWLSVEDRDAVERLASPPPEAA